MKTPLLQVFTPRHKPDVPFWVSKAEGHYSAKYIGYYDIPLRDGVHVFYQPAPKFDLGHKHYFGLFSRAFEATRPELGHETFICDATTILEARYPAIELPSGEIMASRFRHDFRDDPSGAMIDGGLSYVRFNPNFPITGAIVIQGDKEVYIPN